MNTSAQESLLRIIRAHLSFRRWLLAFSRCDGLFENKLDLRITTAQIVGGPFLEVSPEILGNS
jgi:hypothetical protein